MKRQRVKFEKEDELVTPASRINRERRQPKPLAHAETTVPVQLLEALLILCGEGDAKEEEGE